MSSPGHAPLRLLIGLDTRIEAIDGRLATWLGHGPAHLLKAPFSSLIDPDDVDAVGADLVALVEGARDSVTAPRRLRTAGGDAVSVILSLALRRNPHSDRPDGFRVAVLVKSSAALRPPALLDHHHRLRVPAALIDADGRIVDANAAWAELFAEQGAAAPGGEARALLSPDDRRRFDDTLTLLRDDGEPSATLEARCARADGAGWVRYALAPYDERHTHFTVLAEDISTERLANRILEANASLFRSLAESAPIGVARLADDLSVVYANPAWERITGSAEVALPELIAPAEAEATVRHLHDRISRSDPAPIRTHLERTPGPPVSVQLRVATVHDDELGVVGHIAVLEETLPMTAEGVGPIGLGGDTADLYGMADLVSGAVLELSDAARELLQITGSLEDVSLWSLYAPDDHTRYSDEVYPALRRGETWRGEITMVDASGGEHRVYQAITAELGPDGEPVRGVSIGREVIGNRSLQDELVYRATHDQLTGLPNRGLLRDHLTLALARSARDHRPIAVIFVDLDHFKAVNDTYGHDAGDQVLRDAAQLMAGVLRPSDTVARIGGDEFVVLCEDIEGEVDAMVIAERLRNSLANGALLVHGQPVDIGTSIGVAISNGDDHHDGDTLLRQADAAMYRAKQSGRSRIELFDDVLRDRTQRRHRLTDELKQAIDDRQFEVHYQPLVDLGTGTIRAVEAYVRWVHPTQGLLGPENFLELAVETGLDLALDRLVLHRAVTDAASWRATPAGIVPPLHVNVTARSVVSGTLAATVSGALANSGLPASRLRIEIPESFMVNDATLIDPPLAAITALGVGLVLDDMGIGPTSLRRLRAHAFTMMKVDGSLARELTREAGARDLVAAFVALGRALDVSAITVEHVEDHALVPVLRDLGVHVAQGRLFSRAVPADALVKLLPLRSTLVD